MKSQCTSIKVVKINNTDSVNETINGLNKVNETTRLSCKDNTKLKRYKSPYRTRTDEIIDKYLPDNEISFNQPVNPSLVHKVNHNQTPAAAAATTATTATTTTTATMTKKEIIPKKVVGGKSNIMTPTKPVISLKPYKPAISKAQKISEYIIMENKKENVKQRKPFRPRRGSKVSQSNMITSLHSEASSKVKNVSARGKTLSAKGNGKGNGKRRKNKGGNGENSHTKTTSLKKPLYHYKPANKKASNKTINITDLDPYYLIPDKETMETYFDRYFRDHDYYNPDSIHKMISLLTYQGDLKITRK